MAQVTHKIKWGETLSEIVLYPEYKDLIPGTTAIQKANAVKKLNPGKILDIDVIWAGSTIIIAGDAAAKPQENKTYKATVSYFGLINDNTLAAQWEWSQEGTEKYQLRWMYYINGKAFYGNSSANTVDENDPDASRVSTYSIPAEAEKVTFQVKPIADDTASWEADWSTTQTHYFIGTPGTPQLSIIEGELSVKATLTNIDVASDGDKVEFQLIENNRSIYANTLAEIKFSDATVTWGSLKAGRTYKVRCRVVRSGTNSATSDWSAYSNSIGMRPTPSAGITKCIATLKDDDQTVKGVYLEWGASPTATKYTIQYTTDENDFEILDEKDIPSVTTNNDLTYTTILNLEPGEIYFFRVRAENENGESEWSKTASVVVGTTPEAPTTWSSSTTVNAGDDLNLYWVHNSTDGSSETYGHVTIRVYRPATEQGAADTLLDTVTHTIKKSTAIDERDRTSVLELDTSIYTEVIKLEWFVKTEGITGVPGKESAHRIVYIYPNPNLQLCVSDTADGNLIDTLSSLPLYILASTDQNGQSPIEYYVSIKANEAYETVDAVGNNQNVSAGDVIFARHIAVDSVSDTSLNLVLNAGDINLDNNISYTVTCVVTMDTGLTDEVIAEPFTVAWSDDLYWPNASIRIDEETLVAYINPYCTDAKGDLIDNVLLSVYRRESDGTFTKIIENLENDGSIGITDPHPSLDYARYRIVATSKTTGAISYYDRPGHPVGEKSAVIQWDEEWSKFDISTDDEVVQTPWSGSVLKLPYNLDVTDSYNIDVSHIKYIGREHPVTYYGTQIGETATWNIEIDKNDKDTIHALRRLARWMGDVYVREPSGNGYWASITISMPTKHCEVTIPVTINITRVEGGV